MTVYSIRWMKRAKLGTIYGTTRIELGSSELWEAIRKYQDAFPEQTIKQVTLRMPPANEK